MPVPPVVPDNCAVMTVPAVTSPPPVPVMTWPTAIVPDPTAVTVIVVVLMDAVNDVVAVDTEVPCTIFAVGVNDVPFVENGTWPTAVAVRAVATDEPATVIDPAVIVVLATV